MKYLGLFIVFCFTWLLVQMAGAAQAGVRADQAGKKPGGVSLFPGVPLIPLAFTGIAWLGDIVRFGLGTIIIGALHALAAVLSLGYIFMSIYRLRSRRTD